LAVIDFCVASLSNCEIWLQIKPILDVSLTLDAGKLESMLEFDLMTMMMMMMMMMMMLAENKKMHVL